MHSFRDYQLPSYIETFMVAVSVSAVVKHPPRLSYYSLCRCIEVKHVEECQFYLVVPAFLARRVFLLSLPIFLGCSTPLIVATKALRIGFHIGTSQQWHSTWTLRQARSFCRDCNICFTCSVGPATETLPYGLASPQKQGKMMVRSFQWVEGVASLSQNAPT